MKFRVVRVGRSEVAWAKTACDDYRKRLSRMAKVDEVFVKAERFTGDIDAVRRAESERLLEKVAPTDRLVVLDERGVDLTTHDLADWIREGRVGAVPRMTLVLGGAYGHDPMIREAAWRSLRLSSLVLNHDLARVVLYEQLYRAMTVVMGRPYHH